MDGNMDDAGEQWAPRKRCGFKKKKFYFSYVLAKNMVEVSCPHCDETVLLDTKSGVGFNCPFCQKDFIFEENENLDDDIDDEKSWIQFNFNPENDIELMNGKSGRYKQIAITSAIVVVPCVIITYFAPHMGICSGLFALVWVGGLQYLFTMKDYYYALYFTKSSEILTIVSTEGNGPWYIERQVHKSQIQKAELKRHDGGEHGSDSYSLRLIGNNWIEHIDALGNDALSLKKGLFEECIGIKIE